MVENRVESGQKAIPALTGLRFVAAIFVVLTHAMSTIVPVKSDPSVFYLLVQNLYNLGMPLFFVLSGFVIHYGYGAYIKKHGMVGAYNFFVARFARLYPLFFVCLMFDLAIRWSYSQLPPSTTVVLPFYLTLTQTWIYSVYGDLALPAQFGWVPSVAWSISTEWFFYLIYPILNIALMQLTTIRANVTGFVLIALLGALAIVVATACSPFANSLAIAHFGKAAGYEPASVEQSFVKWLFYFSPYLRTFEFLLGSLCATIYIKVQNIAVSRIEQRIGVAVMFLAIVVSFATLAFFELPGWLPAHGVLSGLNGFRYVGGYAVPLAILIFCCARYSNPITRALATPRMVFCGELSYSIYLLHMLMLAAFRWEAAGVTSPQVAVGDILRLVVTCAAIVGISIVTWSLIEMPAKRWLYRKLARSVVPLPKPIILIQPE
jgi:peptidoglycan/LPS O-acetylase OafA/YrhL